MKSKKQQQTPSWKVNLTEKFSSLSKKIRSTRNGKNDGDEFRQHLQLKLGLGRNFLNFDEQLEQRLNYIPSKQQLSSNRKNKISHNNYHKNDHHHQNYQLHNNLTQNYLNKMNQQQRQVNSVFDLSSVYEPYPQKLNFNKSDNQNQQFKDSKQQKKSDFQQNQFNLGKPYKPESIFINQKQEFNVSNAKNNKKDNDGMITHTKSMFDNIFTNDKIINIFIQFFNHREQVELSQFVNACLIKLYFEQNFSADFKYHLIDKMRQLFCTTDQHLVSFNAIQMLTKRKDLKLIYEEQILNVKYEHRKKKLEKEYEGILEEIIEQQSLIDSQQKQIQLQNQLLSKKKKEIIEKEKELSKKEKNIKSQEKELMEKEKSIKKLLEQKTSKLLSEISFQYQKATKEIDKKANIVQRNAKNKLELIEKRLHDIKAMSYKVNSIPEKDNEQNQYHKKCTNEILVLKNKIKKIQKQYQNTKALLNKQLNSSQNQSNALLKANTIMQGKFQKLKGKNKELQQNLSQRQKQIQQLKFQMTQKTSLISLLQSQLNELNKMKQIQFGASKGRKETLNNERILKQTNKQGKKSKKTNEYPIFLTTNSQTLQCQLCKNLINQFNDVFQFILSCFDEIDQKQKQSIRLEQILLKKSHQIFVSLFKILLRSIEINNFTIQSILQIMKKVLLTKCSFLKFQSLNQIFQIQNKSVEDYLERLVEECFDKDKVKYMIANLEVYIFKFRTKYSLQNLFNLLLILGATGFNQHFHKTKNKVLFHLEIIHSQVLQQIQKAQNKQKKSLNLNKLDYEQSITYLLPKYLSYSSTQDQTSIFVEILLQICNFYSVDGKEALIFKSLLTLQNYKYLFNYILMNCSDHNLENDLKNKDTLENVSIILQRFCYFYGEISLAEDDLKSLKKLYKKLIKRENILEKYQFLKENLKSIISTFDNSDQKLR